MKKGKKDIPFWAKLGHRKPITRREFLASGLLPFSASLFVPGLLQIPFRAAAQVQNDNLCAFVNLQLAGGAAMGGNFLPHNVGREPLSNYDIMGLGDSTPPIDSEFGGVPFAGDGISKMLTGIRNRTDQVARDRTAMVAVCHTSRDDSAENEMDITALVQTSGLVGSLLPSMANEFRFLSAYIDRLPPLMVSNVNTVRDAIGLSGALGSLGEETQASLMRTLTKLYNSQSEKLLRQPSGEQLAQTLRAAGVRNEELLALGPDIVDPLKTASVGGIWGINANTPNGNINKVAATLVFNALKGHSGPVSIQLSGYDYHDNTRTTGDRKDLEAGEMIGRILQTARLLEKKVFILVNSDGAVSSVKSADRDSPWRGDRGLMGASYMLVYDPAGRPETSDFQVGHYTANQSVDTDYFIGASPRLASAAIFANYLAANERLDIMDKVLPSAFNQKQLKEIVKFGA